MKRGAFDFGEQHLESVPRIQKGFRERVVGYILDNHDYNKDLPVSLDGSVVNAVSTLDLNSYAFNELFRNNLEDTNYVTLFNADGICHTIFEGEVAIFCKGYVTGDGLISVTNRLGNLQVPAAVYKTNNVDKINEWIAENFQIIGTFQNNVTSPGSAKVAVDIDIKKYNDKYKLPSVSYRDGEIACSFPEHGYPVSRFACQSCLEKDGNRYKCRHY